MPRFNILSGSTLIGYSELEFGDPPMGVAFGKFLPSPAYATIQEAVIASNEGSQGHLCLSAQKVEGEVLLPETGVRILDFSAELDPDEIEVSVVGIGYPLYGELFPEHVAAYYAQFP